jgi:5'-nucleotidase
MESRPRIMTKPTTAEVRDQTERGKRISNPSKASCSIDCACLGNHDFDFGYPHLQRLMQQTNFPWTFTNIADVGSDEAGHSDEPEESDKQVEGTIRSWICEIQGVRIGCVGLVEKDWIDTVPAFPPNFRYRSMVATARKVSEELRGEGRCDIIIAITHCRLPNDIDLANDLGATKGASSEDHGVDLVLGGHDHTYYIGRGIDEYSGEEWHTDLPGLEKDKDCFIVKSGTDFHDLSEITLEISEPEEGSAARRRRIVGASGESIDA